MMLTVFGTPSGLTYWVMNAARLASEIVHGPLSLVASNSLEDLRTKWTQREHRAVLFHADTPNREMVDLFVRIPGTAIIVTEPLKTVAHFAGIKRSLDPQAALRFATRSACALLELSKRPDIWQVDRRISDLSLDEFAEKFVARVLPQATATHLSAIKAKFNASNGSCRRVGPAVDAFVAKSLGGGSETSASDGYLSPDLATVADQFEACLRSGGRQLMTWPPSVFVRTSDLTYIDGPLDLVGPARVLISGHSLSVPAGRWRATAEISVSENWSGNKIRSDIFAENRPVSIGAMSLPQSGDFRYELDFECLDPSYPLIFRIATMEGAIEGVLELRRVHFERMP